VCGIAGIWGRHDEPTVRSMLAALAHRGPDAHGTATVGRGVLGHQRLAIVDLETGDQPIVSSDGTATLVGNGEVYSAPRQRRALMGERPFVTRSDNEVALHLYAQHGAAGLHELDGMYALAIATDDELVLHRDPVGIKPLYLGELAGATVFASELKALPSGTTGVCPIPPGGTWSSTRGWLDPRPLPDPAGQDGDGDEHAQRLRTVLERAVEERMMADVPVGAFLSGGLDSSALAAMVARHAPRLHTFTVGTTDSPDLHAARTVAAHLGSTHHEHLLTEDDVLAELPRVVWALESFDQDLVRSALPTFLTARLAAQHVKVVHTGEGADELFAGYAYYADLAPMAVPAELRRSIAALHAVNLQRVDRMTMAHGLEARVPFLDLDVIEVALSIPAGFSHARGDRPAKWVLRRAVEDLLPADVVWRGKEQFGDGSGASQLLDRVTARAADAVDVDHEQALASGTPLRSAEEAAYHRMLRTAYDDPALVLANVARWEADRPAG
jgi:asparagine synthase (glutamine-hydrolysing)